MFMATDNLIDDIGLFTPDTEDIFRSLFPTGDQFKYVRRNGAGDIITIKPGEWTDSIYEAAAIDSAKHDCADGFPFGWSYKGPYLFGVFPPKKQQAIRNVVFDVDDPSVVPFLLTTPLKDHGIWCPSNTPGRWHVHLIVHETPFTTAGLLVSDWFQAHGLMGKIETNVTGLKSVTLPGQAQKNLPCYPGTDEPICDSHAATKEFYADWYRYRRVQLEDVLIVEAVSTEEPQTVPLVVKEPKIRKLVKADIPGLNHSIGCTVGGQRYDFYSVGDCLAESDGFIFSNAYYPAVLRKFRGDTYLAVEEVMKHRQSMRTPTSKKENSSFHATHVNSMMKWFGARYDESKLKHDPQQELEDKTALIDFFIRDKRSLSQNCQKALKLHRSAIRTKYGRSLYRDAIETIPFVISSIDRFNGRIATKSRKKRPEYIFSDSVCWLDFPTINGSRRKRDAIKGILKDCGIFTDQHEGKDTHDHARHLCSRWNVCTAILDRTELREKKNESGNQKSSTESFSSANIGAHFPEPKYDYSMSSDPYAQVWNDSSELTVSFVEKVHRMKQTLTPEM